MLTKDRRRAERRHRSYLTWMRRLRNDQYDHRGPWSPVLDWKDGVCTITPGDRTQLCDCFNLRSRQALRFKDTPNGCACWSCANPRRTYRGKSKMALTFQEQRENIGDRESFNRKKPNRVRLVLIRERCLCGFLFGTKLRPSGGVSWGDRHGSSRRRCPDCTERLGPMKDISMPA
jgi:hypothetical protein